MSSRGSPRRQNIPAPVTGGPYWLVYRHPFLPCLHPKKPCMLLLMTFFSEGHRLRTLVREQSWLAPNSASLLGFSILTHNSATSGDRRDPEPSWQMSRWDDIIPFPPTPGINPACKKHSAQRAGTASPGGRCCCQSILPGDIGKAMEETPAWLLTKLLGSWRVRGCGTEVTGKGFLMGRHIAALA